MRPVILFLLVSTSSLFAQSQLFWQVGYYGNNLWNPGVVLNVETALGQTPSYFLQGKIGGFWDPGHYPHFFLQMGTASRFKFGKRGLMELGLHPLSILNTFLPETYQLDEDLGLQFLGPSGRAYLAPSASIGFGKKASKILLPPWIIRVHVMTLFPFNTGVMPLLNIEVAFKL
ncbi:MAG: hypothetical protein AAFR61_00470 [Bacteroidota bacterium]